MTIEATKFYVRYREGLPETELQDYARRGMWSQGVETVPFEWIDDINSLDDLGPTVGIAGYIGDVHRGLTKLGKSIPANVDYPKQLTQYLGRNVWKSTMEEVRNSSKKIFVKPTEHKQFTGFVWNCDAASRMKVVTISDDTAVWCSDPIEIIAEYRSMILDNKVLDCRRYSGSWSDAPSRILVEQAVIEMKNDSPRAYCLDWGITSRGGTALIEMNDGFAFGHYGLQPILYAKMLSARWNEMVK